MFVSYHLKVPHSPYDMWYVGHCRLDVDCGDDYKTKINIYAP